MKRSQQKTTGPNAEHIVMLYAACKWRRPTEGGVHSGRWAGRLALHAVLTQSTSEASPSGTRLGATSAQLIWSAEGPADDCTRVSKSTRITFLNHLPLMQGACPRPIQ